MRDSLSRVSHVCWLPYQPLRPASDRPHRPRVGGVQVDSGRHGDGAWQAGHRAQDPAAEPGGRVGTGGRPGECTAEEMSAVRGRCGRVREEGGSRRRLSFVRPASSLDVVPRPGRSMSFEQRPLVNVLPPVSSP